ncbi:MAG: CCA tRNA nucleotidyltransferase [Pseudomonadota bacterium]
MTRIDADWLTKTASQRACAVLTDAGYQAWFVGGCVRNALLGAPVSDLDLTTDARPDRVMALAKAAGVKAVPTGFDHGTVTLVIDEEPFEVTTFRRDVATDGRRATVAYAEDIAEDARRRDFTMNALYAAPDGEIADPLGGLRDLRARRVRFIEDADRRIKEDYLRILRFFRFHAWYGDDGNGIDPDGLAACAENVEGLAQLSLERITAETLKLLAAPDPAPALASFAATGGLGQILPGAVASELAPLVHLEHLHGIAPDPIRRLAALGGDPAASLRLSKTEAKHLDQVTGAMSPQETAYRFGAEAGIARLLLEHAAMGTNPTPELLCDVKDAATQTCPVTAADFMPHLSGPALGAALRKAEVRWIQSGFTLTKDDLLD